MFSSILGAVTNSPYFIYLKLMALAAVVAAAGYAAWHVRGLEAEREKNTAVAQAVESIQSKLTEEQMLRGYYQQLADAKLAKLYDLLSNIKIEHRTITNNITNEREVHKEFYSQPLPPGGYEQWKRARSSAQAASQP